MHCVSLEERYGMADSTGWPRATARQRRLQLSAPADYASRAANPGW
ncbi:Uncharacterised protein [Bordetella pertussis]|nr:Uncharacterised protein [Bordetella pertussis]